MKVIDLLKICIELAKEGKGDYIINIDGLPLDRFDIDVIDAFKQLCIGWVK